MQIREVLKTQLHENVLRTIGQDIKGAVTEPFKKLGAVLDTPGAMTDPKKAAGALDQNEREQAMQFIAQRQQQKQAQVAQQTQQRAKELAQQWAQQIKTQSGNQSSTNAPFAGRATPLPTVTISGNLLTKGPDGLWHGEDGRTVTDPAQIAKIDKAYYTGMPNQKGTVKERRINNPQQTATRRAARAQTRKGTTTSAAGLNDSSGFVAWSDQQLRDVIPGTRTEISMDKVRKNSTLYQPVKATLDRVLKNPSDTVAVQDYFETAMSAMQQLSAQFKQSRPAYTGVSGGGAATGSGILDKFISASQIQDLQRAATDPATASRIKKELGIR